MIRDLSRTDDMLAQICLYLIRSELPLLGKLHLKVSKIFETAMSYIF